MRNDRNRHARPGEELQLYTGMRTKACRLIGRAECVSVTPVRIDFERETVEIEGAKTLKRPKELDDFARRDGFKDWDSLVAFWGEEHGSPASWSGVIIHWQSFKAAEEIPRHERGRGSQRRRRRTELASG